SPVARASGRIARRWPAPQPAATPTSVAGATGMTVEAAVAARVEAPTEARPLAVHLLDDAARGRRSGPLFRGGRNMPTSFRRLVALTLVIVLATAVPAGTVAPRPALAADTSVGIVDAADPAFWGFNPAQVTVNVGDTVTWANTGRVLHTVTANNG